MCEARGSKDSRRHFANGPGGKIDALVTPNRRGRGLTQTYGGSTVNALMWRRIGPK